MNNLLRLNNNAEIPRIGYGVYQIPPSIAERCVKDALSVGYRLIDTAQCYGNEQATGKAVRESGISRDEIFVTSKLWGCVGYGDAAISIDNSLKALGMDYVDLLLIHEPTGNYREVYRALEDAYRAGKLRAIGVANFLEKNYVNLLETAEIVPAIDQIETHVFRQQKRMRSLLAEHGTACEAWSPLACGRNGFFDNPTLKEIGEKYGKSPAQVGLRFLYQQDVVSIPKTVRLDRMRENLNVLDFVLTDEDMASIRALDKGKSLFSWW